MNSLIPRRSFLRRATVGGLGLAALTGFVIGRATAASRKLRCVQIGCGNRASTHLDWLIGEEPEDLVAIVDPDEKGLGAVTELLKKKSFDVTRVKTFTDYRVMFDKIGKEIDAVLIATPNHHHALPAARAIDLGIGVFCEKPLTHTIEEARLLRKLAAKAKAPTQMGNQGHCEDGYRRLCEFVWGGVVGKISETHSWDAHANGGLNQRPPKLAVPKGLHWDTWIGPAPYRDYHDDLHPHEWHTWYDFGNGTIANMGVHVMDGVYWALKLDHPSSFEVEEMRDGGNERFPTGARIRFDFPARGDMPPVKAYWYEGMSMEAGPAPSRGLRSAKKGFSNEPPILKELRKQYPDEEFGSSGTLYIGEKGILFTGTYGGKMHILPLEKMQQIQQPPRTLPRPKNVMADFLDACRTGRLETAASFDYASRLTEFVFLGNLATRAGAGKKLYWDGPNMKVTNLPELNQFTRSDYRKGWAI